MREAENNYFRVVEERFVEPLLTAALSTNDPLRRIQYGVAVETTRLLFNVSVVDYRELLSHGLTDPRLKSFLEMRSRLSADLLKVVGALGHTNHVKRWNTTFGR